MTANMTASKIVPTLMRRFYTGTHQDHLPLDLGGRLYLAAVQDTFSRAIVSWSMASHMRAELVYRDAPWPTRSELTSAIFEWIEVFYNRERKHSTLGYLSLGSMRKNLSV